MMKIFSIRINSRVEINRISILSTTSQCLEEVCFILENSSDLYTVFKFWIDKIKQNALAVID